MKKNRIVLQSIPVFRFSYGFDSIQLKPPKPTKCKLKIAEWGRRQWSDPSLTKAVLFLKSQEDYSQSACDNLYEKQPRTNPDSSKRGIRRD